MNILVVDADRDMVEMLTGWLRSRGYTVHFSFTGDRIRAMWQEHEPDLVIADVEMAGVDVLGTCRELRSHRDALVLAMATEHNPQMEIHCLESGADAFIGKPFLPKHLLAHIHALSRRVRSTLQRQPSSLMVVGPIHFDASRNEVTVNGRTARLTPTESRILQILAANTGDVCTLNQIVSHAWGYGDDGDTYLIKAHIRHLREKIEPVPSKPRYIRTVPGVGYTLSTGAEETLGGLSEYTPQAEEDQAEESATSEGSADETTSTDTSADINSDVARFSNTTSNAKHYREASDSSR